MLAYSLFFSFLAVGTFSCTEDADDLSDFSNDNQALVERGIIGNNHNDDIDYRPKPDYENPDDCICYLTVDDVTGDGVEYIPLWSLEIPGTNVNIQKNINAPGWSPTTSIIPTGQNTFMLSAFTVPSSNPDDPAISNPPEYVGYGTSLMTIEATVKCYLKNTNGTLSLATTTQHTFKGSDGYLFPNYPYPEEVRGFDKEFACKYLTSGGADIVPFGG